MRRLFRLLFGRSGAAAALVGAAVLVGAPSALAAPHRDKPYVPSSLLAAAATHPDSTYRIILQASAGNGDAAASAVAQARAGKPGIARGILRRLGAVNGLSAEVTGRQLLLLALQNRFTAITRDVPVRFTGTSTNPQSWPDTVQLPPLWTRVDNGSLQSAAIAVVDSGVEPGRADFGSRVIASVDLATSEPNSPGDGDGHGTFVAGIAAGSSADHAGAAPNAPIVSLDVVDDTGRAYTSDVIAAAEWILQHKSEYAIRVANFSLETGVRTSIRFDPINRAVERLWANGVVVVAAAGNDRTSDAPNGVLYAPGNDPFVITVGATDPVTDLAAPWSSYGYTPDGFRKPELAAPGRYMVGPTPAGSTLAVQRPDSVVAPGYMQLSGTSFSAPVVSGIAALLIGAHPTWTPDQVKGALMLTAHGVPAAADGSVGVGIVDAQHASAVVSPPNPNAGLDQFLVQEADGSVSFDQASWTDAAHADASWDAASWTDASWTDASWTDASWTDASWTDASWTDASWTTGAGPDERPSP